MNEKFEISKELVEQAQQVGKHDTPQAAIEAALEKYIRIEGKKEIFEISGTIDYDEEYDYKSARNRKTD